MKTTIKDIATQLGLSYSSVSRALNNKEGVSEDTRKQVMKVAKEIGYTPNELARSLVGKSLNTIGVIFPDIKNAYFSEVYQGVLDAASELGYITLFCISNWSNEKEKQYITELQQKRVSGLILKRTNDYIEYSQRDIGIPTVLIENRSLESEFSYVEVDNHLGGEIATKHLLECGYRNIAYVGGLKDARSCVLRYNGYTDILGEYGITANKRMISFGEFTLESGYIQAKALKEKNPKIDAFFASNDVLALGVLKYLHENNYKVPEQVGVIGFDDIKLSDYPSINLTTVKQPTYTLGKNALNLLYEQMMEGMPIRVIYQPELIVRGTTKKR